MQLSVQAELYMMGCIVVCYVIYITFCDVILSLMYIYTYTYTYTHRDTHIYIYIYTRIFAVGAYGLRAELSHESLDVGSMSFGM